MRWSVTQADQAAFAQLSGDVNPLHVDPLAARRLPFGRLAVHGMHLVVRALDQALEQAHGAPVALQATFRHPVGVGDALTTVVTGAADALTVAVDVGPWRAADLAVTLGEAGPDGRRPAPRRASGAIEVHGLDDLAGRSGTLAVSGEPAALAARFPTACARLGPRPVAELLALSRLVGMHLPGLHSLLSAIDLTRRAEPRAEPELGYRVARVDERFRLVVLDVAGAAWTGRVNAFVRPEPVDAAADTAAVASGEFAGQRWLVVGGSRGLGATAVTLLAAGGADVRFTYRVGRAEAEAISDRTGARAWPLDATAPGRDLDALSSDGWAPTHLAWFATPPIFTGGPRAYSDDLYAEFTRVYVDAFEEVVERFAGTLQGALWPSSEAVAGDVPGLAEYADAKRAGEQRAADLARSVDIRIVTPRWPRLLTDQSTSFVPVEFGDTTTEVLTALRAAAGDHG